MTDINFGVLVFYIVFGWGGFAYFIWRVLRRLSGLSGNKCEINWQRLRDALKIWAYYCLPALAGMNLLIFFLNFPDFIALVSFMACTFVFGVLASE